ncbi:RNA polymerase sigma-70 factor [Dyadobacter jiangsuensis]|uniref:RNA polymerase sigma-70 factor (ECF subfamily) n=1 Tax=Dyadobacter jiangsuensis TaxID=1591085 RepID=A0A2P8GJ37_9BACT|nr:RNA polymerase sigma-70 factor [Dyadobacter jiangsuensis]PSL33986.1 RNA polymerase sigma-70 factor (ECF subfamily) [Dyadobacter jiangsuensis]
MQNRPSQLTTIDEQSFEMLYTTYAKKLFRLCCSYLRDEEESKEIVQGIFQTLWERRGDLEIRTSPEHYLIRAAKLQVNRHFRDKAIHDRHLEAIGRQATAQENTTEEMVSFEQLSGTVSSLLAQLPAATRRIFQLSREQGMGNREIAEEMQVSVKTVEYHIGKSIALLRSGLE